MRDVAPKIAPNNRVPRRAVLSIELLLQVRRDVFFNVVLIERLRRSESKHPSESSVAVALTESVVVSISRVPRARSSRRRLEAPIHIACHVRRRQCVVASRRAKTNARAQRWESTKVRVNARAGIVVATARDARTSLMSAALMTGLRCSGSAVGMVALASSTMWLHGRESQDVWDGQPTD